MNDSTRMQLKILVERAVRPVRASTARKRKLREELLAHVSDVFEDERQRCDEATALERTTQRFGTPAELTRQLQVTLPARDAPVWLMDSLVGVPNRGRALTYALRLAGLVGAMFTVGLAIMFFLIGRWGEWLTLARLPALLMPVSMAFLTFCATLLAFGMRQALFGAEGRSWPRILILGVASWLLLPGLNVVWCYALSGALVNSLLDNSLLLLTGMLAPVGLIAIVYAADSEFRHAEEWASLKLD